MPSSLFAIATLTKVVLSVMAFLSASISMIPFLLTGTMVFSYIFAVSSTAWCSIEGTTTWPSPLNIAKLKKARFIDSVAPAVMVISPIFAPNIIAIFFFANE